MTTERETLKNRLHDWIEVDGAMSAVMELLGLLDLETSPYQTLSKHVFWTNHPVGVMAYELLEKLVALGILERRDDATSEIEYRWNPSFRGSWEP